MFDELNSKIVEDFEVVGGVSNFPGFIAHELNIFFDVFDVLNILLGGVSIIEAEITFAVVDFGLHEVEPHSLAVTDMKVAVRFRGESSEDNISEFIDPILKQLLGVQS